MMAVPGARILEVTRGTGSAVQTRSCRPEYLIVADDDYNMCTSTR